MRAFFPFALLVGAGLAACSEPTVKRSEPAAAPAPAAVLGGIDLTQPIHALGTEPFWSLDITPSAITYTSPNGPPRTAANPGPVMQGTIATWTGTGDTPMTVTLIATECSDGMSDRTYPLTAQVEMGGTKLSGCADTQAAFDAAPPA